ncbi:MAG: SMP-30/gluconolactonase/LRE family protein [Acidimicrobiia bacterium]
MRFETLASGYGLVEGPTVDDAGNLYFSDVLGGGVYRLASHDGGVETIVPKRRGVGGIALHANGGLVLSGRDLVHVRAGETRLLFRIEGLPGWNDLCTDASGRVYAGALRFMVFDPDAQPVPGECWRVDTEGQATRLYGGVVHANGISLSPTEDRIYHSDTRAGVVHVHDLLDGEAVNPRRFEFAAGAPDGMAIDEVGCVWVASAAAGCVVRMTPDGEVDRRIEVPARVVTSLCFGGLDRRDLYVTTADNTDDPALRGCVLRTEADVTGAPVNPARV